MPANAASESPVGHHSATLSEPTGASGAAPGTIRSWFLRFCWCIKWSLLALVVLVLLVLIACYYLAGTDSGFARITQIANDRIAGLAIEYSGGNLQDGFSATGFTYSNESIDIQGRGLTSNGRLSCLTKRRFCMENLRVEQLDVTLLEASETPDDAPREGAIVLPDIKLPIDITLSDISVDRLQFKPKGDAPAQIIEDIRLSATTDDSVLTIENVSLAYAQYRVSLTGTTQLTGVLPAGS